MGAGDRVRRTAVCVVLATVVFGLRPLSAHHGTTASYDMSTSVTLTGIVTEWRYVNPHAQLYFDVTDGTDHVVSWGGELGSPTTLHRDGWTYQTFKPGDNITLSVHPSKAGTSVGVVDRSKPVIVNGKELPASKELLGRAE
jgi:hypothetical protein